MKNDTVGDGRVGPAASIAELMISASGRAARVAMVQAADLRNGDDLAALGRFNRAWDRSVAVQRPMRARSMVIIQIIGDEAFQVSLVEYHHVIQAFAPHRANEAFRIGVLPRRPRRSNDLFDAQSLDPTPELVAVNRVTITEQKPWRTIEGKRLDDLLGGPAGTGMGRDVEVQHPAAVGDKIRKQYSKRNVAVGTTKKSTAAVSVRWLARNVLHAGDGGLPRRSMYSATVDSAKSWPSSRNSACRRGARHTTDRRATCGG